MLSVGEIEYASIMESVTSSVMPMAVGLTVVVIEWDPKRAGSCGGPPSSRGGGFFVGFSRGHCVVLGSDA